MKITDWMILVVLAFFALVTYAIHKDDKRKAERRQQDLPHPVERRTGDRRWKNPAAFLNWVLRRLWTRIAP